MSIVRKVIFFIFLLPTFLLAQENIERFQYNPGQKAPNLRLNVVKTNPFALLISQIPFTGEARLLFEHMLTARQSTTFGLSYVFPNFIIRSTLEDLNNQYNVELRLRGYRVQGGYRFYLSNKSFASDGFYIGPHASLYSAKLYEKNFKDGYLQINFANINLLWGYQVLLWDFFAIDTYMGVGYRNNFDIVKESSAPNAPVTFNSIANTPDFALLYNSNFKFSFSVNIGFVF